MARKGRGFGIRGLASLLGFSNGIDQMGARMNALGIKTTCHIQGLGIFLPYSSVPGIARDAAAAARAGHPIILYGHSMGADAAVKVAVRLHAEGLPVALLACFDPTPFGCPDVPPNVEKTLGWWQGRGLGGYQVRPSIELSRRIDKGQAWLSTRQVANGHNSVEDLPALQNIMLDWAQRVTS